VTGSCEHGNEPSGSVKGGDFPELLLASQEGLRCIELVNVD
jgi:hypothetical protein